MKQRMPSLIITLLLCLAGCNREQRTPAEYTYQIRGIVVSTTTNQQGKREIKMRHQAIPEFFDAQGKPEPMHAMTMSFPVDETIDIAQLKKGDEIEATYEVRWKSSPRETITKITPLTAGTVVFPKKATPSATPA